MEDDSRVSNVHFSICEEDEDDDAAISATANLDVNRRESHDFHLLKYCQEIRSDVQSSFLPRAHIHKSVTYEPEKEFGEEAFISLAQRFSHEQQPEEDSHK
eukprot:TRINITY_DN672_c0_g1_i7.p1 TRINITY_DN672_c0_g1~~TRINITY_DN672_c0_g1_i7.p1  ORF type:complete len:101 (+),score=22.19 TRINITY_DN672_c0_g1_i7:131-433(+)